MVLVLMLALAQEEDARRVPRNRLNTPRCNAFDLSDEDFINNFRLTKQLAFQLIQELNPFLEPKTTRKTALNTEIRRCVPRSAPEVCCGFITVHVAIFLGISPNNVPYSTEEEYYRQAVYVPYLDDFCNSLKERFESHKETVASLQHILPEFCTKTDFYSLEAAFNFYEEDLSHKEVVQSEFMLWKEKWSQEKSENLPKTAISSLEKCDKTFFPNIYILLKLLAVLPVSVATVERSFSSLRRLKT
ncbi:hypothetical protein AVEN_116156-1 [Araneus ventricosus]|uniref:HAT C-terminal dimerisation domain-containing protein n=1 Tax=Araneus ventricosus TaxID=182803 RepID=A0A4Y2SVM9_ARAVE|nr:hypothetical protein AVEN_116156-1 [Araneus ventricosus]